MSPRGSTVSELLSGKLIFVSLLAIFVAVAWRYKKYIAGGNNGLCMYNIFSKKTGELWDLYWRGGTFYIARESLNVNSPCCTTLLIGLNISLRTDQSDCSIWSRVDVHNSGQIDNNGGAIKQK